MISNVYKPRRKNKNGKTITFRLYRGRYRLDGDFVVTDVALGTADKQVAKQKLAEIIAEKEREKAELIAPKSERSAAKKRLSDHLEDYIAELKSLGRSEKHYSLVRFRVRRLLSDTGWKLIQDINADGFGVWRNKQKEMAPKISNEYLNSMLGLLH